MTLHLPGCQMSQVTQMALDGHVSMDKSSSQPHYVASSTAEQTGNRRCSRSDRGSITTETSFLHSSPPLDRSNAPTSTLRKNDFEEQPQLSVGSIEALWSPQKEQILRSPSYRSHRRTSWIEQSNLSADSVEQKITFSYEHSTAPGVRLSKKVSTSLCNPRSPQSEAKLAYSPFMTDQRTGRHADISLQNSPIKSEGQRIIGSPPHVQSHSPYKFENGFHQTDNAHNSAVSPQQQLQQNISHGSTSCQQLFDSNFDVSIGPFTKPKLVRLRSEPGAFSTLVTDATLCGIEQGMPDSRRRREDLKRSMSFEVTLPSYFETLWTNLGASGQLVATRPQLPTSRPSRRHLSLHLEGVSGDFISFQTGTPLQFHETRSDNIELQNNKSRARRQDSFCMGICFSNRPVAINEKVTIKIVETNISWSGLLRFGFTSINPATIQGSDLPRYACPDLTSKPGYWATALSDRYTSTNILIHFSVNRGGHVLYGVNGEDKGVFFSGVVTLEPLWVLLDIYGNTVAVEFSHGGGGGVSENDTQTIASNFGANQQTVDPETNNLSSISLSGAPSSPSEPSSPPPMYWHADLPLAPLQFYPLQGRGIVLGSDGCTATRMKEICCSAVVFTARPICCGETLAIQVLGIDRSFAGGIGFGLTARDPATEDPGSLSDDSDVVPDRHGYWVVNKDVCSNPTLGDELIFSVLEDGEVRYVRNNEPAVTLMQVDPALTLWPFFDVYGNITTIKLIGITMTPIPGRLLQSPALTCCSDFSVGDCASGLPEATCGADDLKSGILSKGDVSPVAVASDYHTCSSLPTSRLSSSSGEYPEEVFSSYPTSTPSTPLSPLSLEEEAADCKVCWERLINCVLYTCGHMCLCFDCATIIRSEKGLCPICRQSIVDVIKIYKS